VQVFDLDDFHRGLLTACGPELAASCARPALRLNMLDFGVTGIKFRPVKSTSRKFGTNRMRRRRQGFHEEAAPFSSDAPGHPLREVQASEAKTHLPQLLDEVERGATIVITRHGRRIARLVPAAQHRQQEIAEALENIKKLGKEIRAEFGGATVEEILAWRHEGHKY
jgi:prevent-host-death family protein